MENLSSFSHSPLVFGVQQLRILVLLLVLEISYVVIYVVNVWHGLHLEKLVLSQFLVKGRR